MFGSGVDSEETETEETEERFMEAREERTSFFFDAESEKVMDFALGYPNKGKRVLVKMVSDRVFAQRCTAAGGKRGVDFGELKRSGVDDDIDTDEEQVEDEFRMVLEGLKQETQKRYGKYKE